MEKEFQQNKLNMVTLKTINKLFIPFTSPKRLLSNTNEIWNGLTRPLFFQVKDKLKRIVPFKDLKMVNFKPIQYLKLPILNYP